MSISKISIFELQINNLTLNELSAYIFASIISNEKTTISYVTANSLNKIYNNETNKTIFEKLDLIHTDGIGVFIASKYLLVKKDLKKGLRVQTIIQY